MKHKYSITLVAATLFTVTTFGQTVQQKVEAAAKDPARKEHAAKADVRIFKQADISEKQEVLQYKSEQKIKATRAKKSCKKKTSKLK